MSLGFEAMRRGHSRCRAALPWTTQRMDRPFSCLPLTTARFCSSTDPVPPLRWRNAQHGPRGDSNCCISSKHVKRTSWPCGHSALAVRVTDQGDQRGVGRMASAVMGMFTDSATAELGRRTIVTGITKIWFSPAVKAAARRRRAALNLMLCRPYDAFARSNTAAAGQEFTAAVRPARGAHRVQLERKCAHHFRMSPDVPGDAMHEPLERLAGEPRSQGIPSLRRPVSGLTCTTDAANAAALAAFTAEVGRAPAPATQEERASVARAHAALAAEQANRGHDALGLGV